MFVKETCRFGPLVLRTVRRPRGNGPLAERDETRQSWLIGKNRVPLSPQKAEAFRFLALHPGVPVSRRALAEVISSEARSAPTTMTLAKIMQELREAVREALPGRHCSFETLRSSGVKGKVKDPLDAGAYIFFIENAPSAQPLSQAAAA